jgi:hypothetical protein
LPAITVDRLPNRPGACPELATQERQVPIPAGSSPRPWRRRQGPWPSCSGRHQDAVQHENPVEVTTGEIRQGPFRYEITDAVGRGWTFRHDPAGSFANWRSTTSWHQAPACAMPTSARTTTNGKPPSAAKIAYHVCEIEVLGLDVTLTRPTSAGGTNRRRPLPHTPLRSYLGLASPTYRRDAVCLRHSGTAARWCAGRHCDATMNGKPKEGSSIEVEVEAVERVK